MKLLYVPNEAVVSVISSVLFVWPARCTTRGGDTHVYDQGSIHTKAGKVTDGKALSRHPAVDWGNSGTDSSTHHLNHCSLLSSLFLRVSDLGSTPPFAMGLLRAPFLLRGVPGLS
jgi:hypothetical protein